MFLKVIKQTRAQENGKKQGHQIHANGEQEGLKPSEIKIGVVGFHRGIFFQRSGMELTQLSKYYAN